MIIFIMNTNFYVNQLSQTQDIAIMYDNKGIFDKIKNILLVYYNVFYKKKER